MSIWFTSDHHFFHKNILKYCGRPFKNLEEMHEMMIKNWNSKIKPSDTVYYLGDFGLGPKQLMKELMVKLNGKRKILIKGNHDKSDASMLEIGFTEIHKYMDLNYQNVSIFLSHVPMRSIYHRLVLCGHVHEKMKVNGNIYNVGVDVNDFTPISINEILINYWKTLKEGKFIPMEFKIEGEDEQKI